jgi:hypothetical protein
VVAVIEPPRIPSSSTRGSGVDFSSARARVGCRGESTVDLSVVSFNFLAGAGWISLSVRNLRAALIASGFVTIICPAALAFASSYSSSAIVAFLRFGTARALGFLTAVAFAGVLVIRDGGILFTFDTDAFSLSMETSSFTGMVDLVVLRSRAAFFSAFGVDRLSFLMALFFETSSKYCTGFFTVRSRKI